MKTITQLTEEELLKALESEEDVKEIGNELVDFVSVFKLKPGNNKVPFKSIKTLYKKWSKTGENYSKLEAFISNSFSVVSGYVMLDSSPITEAKKNGIKISSRIYDKLKKPKYHTQYVKFIKHYNIQNGDWLINEYILYHYYDKWFYETKQELTFDRPTFRRLCNHYFKKQLIKNELYYKVNEEFILSLNKETIKNVKETHQKEKQKKLNKASSTKKTIQS